jgi:hypothetical protein
VEVQPLFRDVDLSRREQWLEPWEADRVLDADEIDLR